MKNTTRLKDLIKSPEILRMPCVHDALCARIAMQAGFAALCAGGYGASASLLGQPDVGLMTMTEMADHIRRLTDCVDLPLLADGDTGHGDVNNVARTVKAFEKAGAAGIFIEDQVSPKRCGHMEGKDVVGREEMLARIKAALDARTDPDFVVMARTDALAVLGMEEALTRGRLLLEAGADIIFVEAPRTEAELARVAAEIPGPTFTVYLEGGKIPMLPADRYGELGFSVVAYATSGLYAAAHAVRKAMDEIKRSGETRALHSDMMDFHGFNEMLGLSEIRRKEKKYF
ncbi:isocitrate lyase/PEP mutase family protein [Fundidesulfovibrio terrae]|uniref:isocitrate lyase/PEP mutase family protein n=1 Tax=Fundidesulfovibrio terrae TaxID=2922866 RepID=UPI001FAF70ED|nr:isocitrate lyase/PEP mutase family protein [Fundidesulfovibrio terrae]